MGFLVLQTAFDATVLDQAGSMLPEKVLSLAVGGALQKTSTFITRRLKKDVSVEMKIPQKALKNRIKSTVNRSESHLSVWVGTELISPGKINTPAVYGIPGKTGGVKAGRLRYRGAFVTQKAFSRDDIWIRTRSPHYSPALYPGKSFSPPGRDDKRFPIVRAGVDIDGTVQDFFYQMEPEIVSEFQENLGREIDRVIQTRGGSL